MILKKKGNNIQQSNLKKKSKTNKETKHLVFKCKVMEKHQLGRKQYTKFDCLT